MRTPGPGRLARSSQDPRSRRMPHAKRALRSRRGPRPRATPPPGRPPPFERRPAPSARPALAAPGGPQARGDRAQSFAVAQERSSSDLALDFVTPELVLAARVYGLGPAEAAQAARLAIAGPGPLGAMASTVDRTFVDAMAIVHQARGSEAERRQRILSPGSGTISDTTIRGLAAQDVARGEQATGEVARDLVAADAVRDLVQPSGATR